jgi:hypothetical protein
MYIYICFYTCIMVLAMIMKVIIICVCMRISANMYIYIYIYIYTYMYTYVYIYIHIYTYIYIYIYHIYKKTPIKKYKCIQVKGYYHKYSDIKIYPICCKIGQTSVNLYIYT